MYAKYLKSVSKWEGIQIHYLFVDFKAAYDSIDRIRLYLVIKEMQIPKKLVNLVRITMRNTQYRIIQSTLSEPIPIRNGVCQGDAI
jgi:sorting nexin-29